MADPKKDKEILENDIRKLIRDYHDKHPGHIVKHIEASTIIGRTMESDNMVLGTDLEVTIELL